jgi:hypothetical protein
MVIVATNFPRCSPLRKCIGHEKCCIADVVRRTSWITEVAFAIHGQHNTHLTERSVFRYRDEQLRQFYPQIVRSCDWQIPIRGRITPNQRELSNFLNGIEEIREGCA